MYWLIDSFWFETITYAFAPGAAVVEASNQTGVYVPDVGVVYGS